MGATRKGSKRGIKLFNKPPHAPQPAKIRITKNTSRFRNRSLQKAKENTVEGTAGINKLLKSALS
jgi:hypothetical protein